MNPVVGWVLAAILLAASWRAYGWPGVALAATVIVFWLLLQFSRAMRVMRRAATSPVGHIDSAVMLNATLKRGMTMMQVVAMTRSLGRSVSTAPERWAWGDEGGVTVTLKMDRGRLQSWELTRPEAGTSSRST